MKKKVVVLTGAGISAESGLKTFRDSDGLWEGYNVYDVATPEAWQRNPEMVLDFYNQRRKGVIEAIPNAGHFALVELEKYFDVHIITQNIDNLHEKAGSKNVLHLHGEILKSKSSADDSLIYDIKGWELKLGEKCELGSQLRPFVVWFGEAVPMIEPAAGLSAEADIFIVAGTSLAVYPAAGLLNYVNPGVPIYVVDPNQIPVTHLENTTIIREKAGTGLPKLVEILTEG